MAPSCRVQSILPAALGHRRVSFVIGELWMDAAIDRLTGYKQALATVDVGL